MINRLVQLALGVTAIVCFCMTFHLTLDQSTVVSSLWLTTVMVIVAWTKNEG